MIESTIFIFGTGGHAKVVIDIVEREGVHRIAYLADDNILPDNTELMGYKIIGGREELLFNRNLDHPLSFIVAVGNNETRGAISHWLCSQGFLRAKSVHPSAHIARCAQIGEGTVIMAGSIINTDAVIGKDVIINTGSTIDHDCLIEDGCHIAPGVTICGTVRIGQRTLISAGVTIGPNVCIGSDVVIGAGSTVLNNIPSYSLAVGTPAKVVKKRS